MNRPRVEDCQRLTAASLRPVLAAGAAMHQLSDGTRVSLLWRPVRGCWGGVGRELLVRCPSCSSWRRVLHLPPGGPWGCWRCTPLSAPSHRRPGGRNRKPPGWHIDWIRAEQRRAAALLGLAQWPPPQLIWGMREVMELPTRPDAPRLSARRREALLLRIDALRDLQIALALPGLCADLKRYGSAGGGPLPNVQRLAYLGQIGVEITQWAVRRPATDPRSHRVAS